MDELIERIAASTGVDKAVAGRAVAVILKFLLNDGPKDKVEALIAALPGAKEAVASAPPVGGGVMGAFGALTAAGLGMGEVQGATREFVAFAKSKVGDATVNAVVGSIPGLSQFV